MASGDALLEVLWKDVINAGLNRKWLASLVAESKKDPQAPFADAGEAVARLLAAGADVEDLCHFARAERYDACYQVLYKIADLGVDPDDFGSLYESLLTSDPSDEEGRPGSWPLPKKPRAAKAKAASRPASKSGGKIESKAPLLTIKKSYDIVFSPDGTRLGVVASPTKIINLDGTKVVKLELPAQSTRLAFNSAGDRIAGVNADGIIGVCNAKTGKLLLKLKNGKAEGPNLCFSPDGAQLIFGDWKNRVWVWNARSGKLDRQFEIIMPDSLIHDLILTPDGRSLIFAIYCRRDEDDHFLSVWDWPLGKQERARLPLPEIDPVKLSAANDSKRVAITNRYKSVAIVDLTSGRTLAECQANDPYKLAWSPDGRWIGVVCKKQIVLLDAASMRQVASLPLEYPCDVAFSPDSRLVAFGDAKNGQVWEVDQFLTTDSK